MSIYNSHLILILVQFILIQLHLCNGSLQRGPPIIWSELETTLKTGDIVETLVIEFFTPCSAFHIPKVGNVPSDKEWCEGEAVSKIIEPLAYFCSPTFVTMGHSLEVSEEEVSNAIGGVISSVLGISSERKSASEYSDLRSDFQNIAIKLHNISTEIQRINSETKDDNKKQALLKTELTKLDDLTQEMEKRVSKSTPMSRSTPTKTGDSPKVTPKVGTNPAELKTSLEVYFALSSSHINTIRQEWQEGKLSLKLFELFMVEIEPKLEKMYKSVKPLKCHINVRDQVGFFQFKRELTDFHLKVFQANPFTYYKLENGTDYGYQLDYVGPSEVVYDDSTDCVVPFNSKHGNVLFFPTADDCLAQNEKSVFKFWRKKCDLMYYLDTNVIQIKTFGQEYAIYCHGFNVTLYKSLYQCPDRVFSVHVNESIKIHSNIDVSKIVRGDVKGTDLSTKINYHLMPKLLNLSMNSFPIAQQCPKGPFPLVLIFGILGGAIGVLFIGFCGVVVYLWRKSKDETNSGTLVTMVRSISVRIPRRSKRKEIMDARKERQSLKEIPENRVFELVQLFEDKMEMD